MNLEGRYDDKKLIDLTRQGVGRMPGFKQLGEESLAAIARFVLRRENTQVQAAKEDPRIAQKYVIDGYNKFLDPEGYPAVAPPWGTLNAVNLDTGKIEWKIPFGEHPELAAKGMKDTGSENYGGGVVTRAAYFLSPPPTRTRSSAPSTKEPASFCGKRPCLFPETLHRLSLKSMGNPICCWLVEEGSPELSLAAFMSPILCPTNDSRLFFAATLKA